MRVLVTGSRNWTDRSRIADALVAVVAAAPVSVVTLVHGGARGADMLAHMEWLRLRSLLPGLDEPEVHKADWSLGRYAGPRRNAEMVASGINLCLAFPLGASVGTRGCMKMAAEAGIEVRVFGE